MNHTIRHLLPVLLTLAAVVTGPSCTKDIAGAGSETTNGITGVVRDSSGNAVAASVVKLVSVDFNRTGGDTIAEAFCDTTGEDGVYRFAHVMSGTYNIIMRGPERSTVCKLDSISFGENDSLLVAPSATLGPAGSIRVVLDKQYSGGKPVIYVPGTDLRSVATGTVAELDGVPAGTISSLCIAEGNGGYATVRSDVEVDGGSTVTIVNPSWPHVGALEINTTSTGAALHSPLYRFPVLLRLSNDDFNFSEAQSDGSDLRFTRNDTVEVPYEVALWDVTNGSAEIWLLIDTLKPDTVSVYTMYWGNESAPGQSDGKPVFDTTDGFAGVWHLEGGDADTVRDATVNGYDGVIMKSGSVTFTDGAIGGGCRFNGTDGYIQMPGTASGSLSFPENGSYTVSAWVHVDQADDRSRVVLSKGNYQYFIFYTSIHTGTPVWEFSEYESGKGWDLSASDVESDGWHLVTGVRNDTRQLLYYDGMLADSTGFTFDALVASNHTYDLVLGRFLQDFGGNDYCFFNGIIDEVTISGTVRSADWIRLCYENQKPGSALVTIRK